jgi:hypothetical protein
VAGPLLSTIGLYRGMVRAISNGMNKLDKTNKKESGKIGYAIAWVLGVPIPLLLVVYLVTRC